MALTVHSLAATFALPSQRGAIRPCASFQMDSWAAQHLTHYRIRRILKVTEHLPLNLLYAFFIVFKGLFCVDALVRIVSWFVRDLFWLVCSIVHRFNGNGNGYTVSTIIRLIDLDVGIACLIYLTGWLLDCKICHVVNVWNFLWRANKTFFLLINILYKNWWIELN